MEENRLSDKEILYFYDLLFRVENQIKNGDTKNYRIDRKEVTSFRKKEQIDLNYKEKPHEHCQKNLIIFKTNKSTCFDLLKHIRNAFAHGNIFHSKNMYIIKDYYKKEITMYGYISQNLLPKLIQVIESTKVS